MPLPFDKSLDEKLIKLVKQNPILYDPKHPKYMDLDSRELAWQKIGDILIRSAVLCKARWFNIRDMMRRKLNNRLQNPTQHSNRYKYEDDLDFMINIFKQTGSGNNDVDCMEDESPSWLEMPLEYVKDNVDYDTAEDVKPDISNCKIEGSHQENPYRFNETNYPEFNPSDPLDIFLLAIGSTLRSLSPYYLNQAKSKIFQLVQDYELAQIMNKDQMPETTDSNL